MSEKLLERISRRGGLNLPNAIVILGSQFLLLPKHVPETLTFQLVLSGLQRPNTSHHTQGCLPSIQQLVDQIKKAFVCTPP
jgi:hypothetical protein